MPGRREEMKREGNRVHQGDWAAARARGREQVARPERARAGCRNGMREVAVVAVSLAGVFRVYVWGVACMHVS